ncbi:MAG: GEVED domain-containing protein, partial [Bacteroidota bacterium]
IIVPDQCTDYEFEFQTNCDTLVTDFGARTVVTSTGCGACLEADYCIPNDFDNEQEHIAAVDFGGIIRRTSGLEPDGYRNVGDLESGSFVRGGVYRLTLTPDVGGQLDEEGWKVYVDWDQNGVLSSTEVVAELDNPEGEPAVVDVTVPADAVLGLTRMRIMMQFGGVRGNACGSSALGEVEDYCLDIVEAEGCPPPETVRATYVEAIDETELTWPASAAPGGSYRLRYRLRGSDDPWVEMDVDVPSAIIRPLNLCAAYELEIASLCDGQPGPARLFLFMDDCTDADDQRIATEEWTVFPNPAYNLTRVRWERGLNAAGIRLFDATGRLLQDIPAVAGFVDIPVGALPAGVYLVELQLRDGRTGLRKLVVR